MAVITSYFANSKKFPKNRHAVSISRFTPKWFEADEEFKNLAPSIKLLNDYKNGRVTEEDYERIYREETLSKLDPSDIAKRFKNSILLCYEKEGDFCHRQIVSNWLNENGYKAHELKKEVKIAVIGSREFNEYSTLREILINLSSHYEKVTIISGGAKGADYLAEKYAKEFNLETKILPADWEKHGKAAGFIRNKEIWDNSDIGVAFWDGKSKGTSHSFDIAKKQNKDLFVFNYKIHKWVNI